jgi:uncharacterized protein (DUF305 family)
VNPIKFLKRLEARIITLETWQATIALLLENSTPADYRARVTRLEIEMTQHLMAHHSGARKLAEVQLSPDLEGRAFQPAPPPGAIRRVTSDGTASGLTP